MTPPVFRACPKSQSFMTFVETFVVIFVGFRPSRQRLRQRFSLACLLIGFLLLAFTPSSLSQPLTISTLAGYPGQGSADGTGSSARFNNPWGVATDSSGNLYVADTD